MIGLFLRSILRKFDYRTRSVATFHSIINLYFKFNKQIGLNVDESLEEGEILRKPEVSLHVSYAVTY